MSSLLVALLTTAFAVGWVPLMFVVGYLLLLTAAAAAPRKVPREAQRTRTFRIVIPAHNEELVLEAVLGRLMAVQYPQANFDVVVIADNCTDRTAEIARNCGVRVMERHDPSVRGKGDALAYTFAHLRDEDFDAYLILDADTLVEPTLLTVMNQYLEAGHRVVQAHYDVLNPFETRRTALMYVALSIFHYVRPLGRSTLGLSTPLTGNGMCFAKAVIDRYAWNAFSLTEDLEYTTTLVRNGEHIAFAPEARIAAQMPVSRPQATTQRMRWEAGRFRLARREGLRLIFNGLRKLDFRIFDWGMELLIPPLAALVLMISGGATFALALSVFVTTPVTKILAVLWGGLLAAFMVFVLAALAVARVPRQGYRALLSAPSYVVWKFWLYILMLMRRTPQTWVRTDRTRMVDS